MDLLDFSTERGKKRPKLASIFPFLQIKCFAVQGVFGLSQCFFSTRNFLAGSDAPAPAIPSFGKTFQET